MTPGGDKRRVNVALTLDEARTALAGDYDLLLERIRQGLEDNEVRCPDCLSPPGARHYCHGRGEVVLADEFGSAHAGSSWSDFPCISFQTRIIEQGYGWVDKASGYGWVSLGRGKRIGAHRLAYEEVHGPIPEGLEIDHLCHNPSCVQVKHLEAVTRTGNMRRTRPALSDHCIHGHPFDEANTIVRADGRRRCRQCNRDNARAWRERQAAKAPQQDVAVSGKALTAREVARQLGVHENTVRNWRIRGIVEPSLLLPSGGRRFSPDDLERIRAEMHAGRLGQ